jgi:hypothetical protein
MDLCSTDSVAAIERYGVRVVNDTLARTDQEPGDQDPDVTETMPPIMEHTGCICTCDGSPSIALLRINDDRITKQRQDSAATAGVEGGAGGGSGGDGSDGDSGAQSAARGMATALQTANEASKAALHGLSGGFHHVLEFVRMRGRFFEDTHLDPIYRLWRKSDARMGYIISPGDFTQCLNESLEVRELTR